MEDIKSNKKDKVMYSIISDLWKFSHKYIDVIDRRELIDWEEFMYEYRELVESGFIEGAHDTNKLRMDLFYQIFEFFRSRDKELRENG